MNIFRLSIRNITSRPLNSILSLILISLGVGMISLLIHLQRHIEDQMKNNVRGIDMVLGAKGSPLQLILASIYHIDAPTGNISLEEAKSISKTPLIEQMVPLSYGDNYKGYRIVGTDYQYPGLYQAELNEGQLWKGNFEVTIGSGVAKNLGLKIGDNFASAHGFEEEGETHDEHQFQVVGIFEHSNSVLDQLILCSTESVWAVHDHGDHEGHEDHENEDNGGHHEDHDHGDHEEHDHEEHEHEEHAHHHEEHEHDENHEDEIQEDLEGKEITAMLVSFRSPLGVIQMPRIINERTNMQAAVPSFEIYRLFSLMGIGISTLNTIAFIIMVVAALSIFISLYSTLKERRYEMALMRTYGASRFQIVYLVLLEGILLTFSGFLIGTFASRLGLWIVSQAVNSNYHYEFSSLLWLNSEYWLLFIALLIGFFASFIPAIQAFRINISKTLSDA